MLEKSKSGDASSSSSSRVVKNPLLSASVTGLTYDDFQHKPLLLPAAPAPLMFTTSIIDSNLEKETKATSEEIEDTFSEINLNTVSDDDILPIGSLVDNSNLQQESISTDGSILSQAASSFSHIPTVASNVFSTFSKVIKDYSPTTNNTLENSSFEKELQKSKIGQDIQSSLPYFILTNSCSQGTSENQSIEEPPKFYSPVKITQPTSCPPCAPPTGTYYQNTYRLSVKKKTYAPIPGITTASSETGSQNQFLSTFNQPVQNQDIPVNYLESTPTQKPGEEKKCVFSFASFVPPIFQNLTDLVQTPSNTNDKDFHESKLITPDLNAINTLNENQIREFNIPVVSFYNSPSELPIVNSTLPTISSFSPENEIGNNSQPTPINFFNSLGFESQKTAVQPIEKNTVLSNKTVNIFLNTSRNQDCGTPPIFPQLSTASNSHPVVSTEEIKSLSNDTLTINQSQQLNSSKNQIDSTVSRKTTSKTVPFWSLTSNSPAEQLTTTHTHLPSKPPTNTGGNFFRLQKGTRLYKSPFSTGDTIHTPLTSNLEDHSPASQGINFPPTNLTGNFSYPTNTNQESVPFPSTQKNVLNLGTPPRIFDPVQQQQPQDIGLGQQQTISFFKPDAAFSSQAKALNESSEELYIKSYEQELIKPEELNLAKDSISDSFSELKGENITEVESKKEEIHQIRSQQHINPFEALNAYTPVTQFSPLSIIKPSINSNQNQVILPSIKNSIESASTTTISENNNDILKDTRSVQNQPQIFDLSDYFTSHVNNNLLQYQQQHNQLQFTTAPVANLSALNITNPVTNSFTSPQFSTSSVSRISNYFSTNQTRGKHSQANIQHEKTTAILAIQQIQSPLSDALSFFDSFNNSTTSVQNSLLDNPSTIEDSNSLRIQNFFNIPPQKHSNSVSELNYKFVGSGITNKRLQILTVNNNDEVRTLSPVSNIVESPPSTCPEFSSDFSQQQQLPAHLNKLSYDELPDEIIEQLKMSNLNEESSKTIANVVYRPVTKHWFYNKTVGKKTNWMPFSLRDSKTLEENYFSPNGQEVVHVEGGRYDVSIKERKRIAVYWMAEPTEVRRCSWFYKSVDSRYVPYEEDIAEKLEEEYKQASISGEWRRKVSLPSGENVTFHGPSVMVHFHHTQGVDAWGGPSTTPARPRVVKRDIEDFNIESGESSSVDHLLLMVHGIGSACDLKFRSVEEVVDEFRSIATQLIQSHYKSSYDNGDVGRVEVLPVSWHSELHSKESGIDERLKAITLESIPKLRDFTNDTLVDILFYTSPVFCQNIIRTVCTAMNNIYIKYRERNPSFKGGVSLAGHSLGSLILFDLLCHQNPVEDIELRNSENPDQVMQPVVTNAQSSHTEQISYTVGPAGTGQPFINYPQMIFQPKKFFALGSPIGMFVTIRGIDKLGFDFKLPTCQGFYNIFHPYDPVAYRIEALINPDLSTVQPVLIPHHKGRKRMHLELKETMTRVSADLKQKIVDTFKNTIDSVYYLASRNKQSDPQEIQKEVDKVLDEHLKVGEMNARSRSISMSSDPDVSEIDLPLGKLNDSRRIDYVLQEAPLEFVNEYLFAFTSHVCYWESEDTILFIMKEIYSLLGINPDSQIPQQSMTIERPHSNKGDTSFEAFDSSSFSK